MTATTPHPRPAAPVPAPVPTSAGWSVGRVVSLVAGCLAALVALGLALAGTAVLITDRAARDSSGYLMSPRVFMGTTGYAITTGSMGMHMGGSEGFMPRTMMGDVRIRATGRGDRDLFVGIGPTAEVEAYLAGTEHAVLDGVDGGHAVLSEIHGSRLPGPPAAQRFWAQRDTGRSGHLLTWSPRSGDWTVVVMNRDGSPAVAADVRAGAEVPALPWIAGGLLVAAALLALTAVTLIALPVKATGRIRSAQR